MRIITGSARGRNIVAPKGVDLRPTSDRVRQALFNAIGPAVQGSRLLDLFCGSGAVGLEALSRGAEHVVFVDLDRRCVESTVAHAQAFGFDAVRYEAIRNGALQALGALAARNHAFDIIYIDPPYASGSAAEALQALAGSPLLAPGALIAVEAASGSAWPEVAGLRLGRIYDHGNSSVAFYHAGESE